MCVPGPAASTAAMAPLKAAQTLIQNPASKFYHFPFHGPPGTPDDHIEGAPTRNQGLGVPSTALSSPTATTTIHLSLAGSQRPEVPGRHSVFPHGKQINGWSKEPDLTLPPTRDDSR